MKKLLALAMALILALSCTAALAEGAGFEIPAFTLTSALSINQETALALVNAFLDESEAAIVEKVLPILSGLGSRLTYADGGVQLDVTLNGTDVATLAGALDENGIAIVSDLFPNYALTVSAETLNQLVAQAASAVAAQAGAFTDEALANAVLPHLQAFVEAVRSAAVIGEPESGEFTFEGVVFNTRIPYEMDMRAFVDAAADLIDNLLGEPAVQAVLETAGDNGVDVNFNVDDFKSIPDDQLPSATAVLYANLDEEGNAAPERYVTVEVTGTDGEETLTVDVNLLTTEDGFRLEALMPSEDVSIVLIGNAGDSGFSGELDVVAEGIFAGIVLDISTGETTLAVNTELYFMDTEAPLISEYVTLAPGGERTMSTAIEDRTALSIEALAEDGADDQVDALAMDLMSNGMGNLITKATVAMPDEVGGLLSTFLDLAVTEG